MPYSIEYFHPKVLAEIESWPGGILADYARIAESFSWSTAQI